MPVYGEPGSAGPDGNSIVARAPKGETKKREKKMEEKRLSREKPRVKKKGCWGRAPSIFSDVRLLASIVRGKGKKWAAKGNRKGKYGDKGIGGPVQEEGWK